MEQPTHSPLGASSAERWMNCPGSVALIKSIADRHESADPEYRKEGTAAHAAIAYCMTGSTCDAWEVVGETLEGVEITVETADAIQVFLDECNPLAEGAITTYVEAALKDPDNPMCYGTIDFGAVHPGILYVRDYKHGQGIVVETRDNPQMMYYAYLLILLHPDVRKVNMRICQPRLPFDTVDEPWEVDADYIMEWAEKTMLPAMERTKLDKTLCPGDHCRFCDAKEYLVCPALKQQFADVAVVQPETVVEMNNAELLASYTLVETVKMHVKAIGDEMLRRLMEGQMKGNGVVKLVNKKANRVWKPEAPELFKSRFGEKAMTLPELKSPAEMEKVDATAKKLVHEYAYTPQSGYTVASADDKRAEVTIQKATSAFKGALDSVPVE